VQRAAGWRSCRCFFAAAALLHLLHLEQTAPETEEGRWKTTFRSLWYFMHYVSSPHPLSAKSNAWNEHHLPIESWVYDVTIGYVYIKLWLYAYVCVVYCKSFLHSLATTTFWLIWFGRQFDYPTIMHLIRRKQNWVGYLFAFKPSIVD
jgi:hypothetical protein